MQLYRPHTRSKSNPKDFIYISTDLNEFSCGGSIGRPGGVAKCIGKWYDSPCEYTNSKASIFHLKLSQIGRRTSAAPSVDLSNTVDDTGRMKGNAEYMPLVSFILPFRRTLPYYPTHIQ